MPRKNLGAARGGGAAAARALGVARQSVASQSSGAQKASKAPVHPSPPRSEKSWGGSLGTHSGMAEKGKRAASSEKAPAVDGLVDELRRELRIAMHERSPLQLQELRSSLQAVAAKAAAA